ncbi:MAG: tyrosine--tRNA ligase, partial [Candidatus Lindowbacteria bacterium]|nr:tyrosine--tRNA ligase [Candidatus Lindowbacteria bacterium]
KAAAEAAYQDFTSRFQRNQLPTNVEEKTVQSIEGKLGIAQLLKAAGLVTSTSDAMRMIKQGAVKIEGERVEDAKLQIAAGTNQLYQVGKRKAAKIALAE